MFEVPMAQMCRSCTSVTPGNANKTSRTACGSTLSGTPSNSRCNDWLNKRQVPSTMTTAIARLTTGSSQSQPCHSVKAPAITTPADTSASAAMCKKAPRMLRSCSPPRINNKAVAVLMTMPTPATSIMVTPCAPNIGSGDMRRPNASHTSAPITTSSSKALANAAKIVPRFQP